MSDFTASAVVAFSETQQAVQGQANQIEFLAHSVGAQRSQMEEMRQKMEQDMRQAMEASIAQRVKDEAGGKVKTRQNIQNNKPYSLFHFKVGCCFFLWL